MTKFYTKSFCAIPFVGLMVDNNQKIGMCCMAPGVDGQILNKQGKSSKAGIDSLLDSWNSQTLKNARQKMIEGQPVASCSNCIYGESVGKVSNREHSIREWTWRLGEKEFDLLVQSVIDNNYAADHTPFYLDLRLGNLCNIKCRMCNPWNSTQIAKEHFELYEKDQKYRTLWTKTAGRNPIELKEDNPWFESDVLWDEIISLIPKLKKVYLTGGEPTLVQGNFRFMQACIDMGFADKITLFFNTNCTNVNKKFLDLISQFNNVEINASLDGVGETNNYIRFPSRWDQIDKNFRKLAELPNVMLKATPALTVYNALESDRIFEYVKSISLLYNKKIEIDYLINSSLEIFDATNIPLADRVGVIQRLELLHDDEWVKSSRFNFNSVQGIIGVLASEENKKSKLNRQDLMTLIESQDHIRSQSLAESLPELYKVLYE